MEWLINRRRMMCHISVPPTYLTFEDAEFWRIVCINYGDYNEIVITDNGDNTVNITTTFKSVIVNPTDQRRVNVKKASVISEETNVDNSQGTYVAGTTKEPVGITQRQCDAVIRMGYYYNEGISGLFVGNTIIASANDLIHFRKMNEIFGILGQHTGGFYNCSNLETVEIPNSLEIIGQGAFTNCAKLNYINFKNVKEIQKNAFQGTSLTSVVLNDGFTTLTNKPFTNLRTLTYIDFPSSTINIDDVSMLRYGSPVVVCRAQNPPTANFGYPNNSVVLYVPQSSIEDYKSATGWKYFADKTYAIEGTWYETHKELEPTT